MIENGKTEKYHYFYKSVYDLEKEILNFAGKSNLDSISNKIIEAVKDESNKTIFRSPFSHNLFFKFYIKFIKK